MLWAAIWPLLLMFAIGIPLCWYGLTYAVDWIWFVALDARRIDKILELYKLKEKERWKQNALKEEDAKPKGRGK